jgi:hypothetical protein
MPDTSGSLSDTTVAPSIAYAEVSVAPIASSFLRASADVSETESISLNTARSKKESRLGQPGLRFFHTVVGHFTQFVEIQV